MWHSLPWSGLEEITMGELSSFCPEFSGFWNSLWRFLDLAPLAPGPFYGGLKPLSDPFSPRQLRLEVQRSRLILKS